MKTAEEPCPLPPARINRKKNPDQRRRRIASPDSSAFEEVVQGKGTDRERIILKAQRADGIWITRTGEATNPPSRHIRIPRRPQAMIIDPLLGTGKHRRNQIPYKKKLARRQKHSAEQAMHRTALLSKQRRGRARSAALAIHSSLSGHLEKIDRVRKGKGKNTIRGIERIVQKGSHA